MSGIEMVNEDMIPIPGAEKFEVREVSAVMEEATMADAPGEIYEPVQTLRFWNGINGWTIMTEDREHFYAPYEIYCNVSCATSRDPQVFSSGNNCLVATGRLTISGGVAYVDVG